MLETNPFKVFSPPGAKYFILGSFAAKDGKRGHNYNWYYSNGRNHFWPILENIYNTELKNRPAQQALFTAQKIAIADIIYQCKRQKNSSLDVHLSDFVYNIKPITQVLKRNKIEKILFTSKFVQKHFLTHFKDVILQFPEIELIALPSPSPRYAAITKAEKIARYKEALPL